MDANLAYSPLVIGLEIALAALGGAIVGAGVMTWVSRSRERAQLRERIELEARLRRDVIPVLERRADVLGIPASQRGHNADGTGLLVSTLARAIRNEEESGDLPFGDTLDASRAELDDELAGRDV